MYYATAQEMEQLDKLAVENGLEIRQMMELAGFHMLEVLCHEGHSTEKKVVIAVGKGNKGGDGLAAARHLVNAGWQNVSIVLVSHELKDDAAHHLRLCEDMGIPVFLWRGVKQAHAVIESADLIIDALIGYHLTGAPREPFSSLIEAINKAPADVVAYDLPSGVDATSGACYEPCITAHATLTLALPKRVFESAEGARISGTVYLVDIGIPQWMYGEATADKRPQFDDGGIIHL